MASESAPRKAQFYSPFRYPGGKSWLLPMIESWLSALDRGFHLGEPFAGGASVGLFAGINGLVETVHFAEMEGGMANFWRTVFAQGGAGTLAKQVEAFKFTDQRVRKLLSQNHDAAGTRQRAFITLLRNRVSRAGVTAPGAGLLRSGEAGKGLGSRWYPATLAKRLRLISKHRKCLEFSGSDAFKLMRLHANDKKMAWFIDPPYPDAGERLYGGKKFDHEALFEVVASLAGPFLLTYESSNFIRKLTDKHSFCGAEIPMRTAHHTAKKEMLISRDLSWFKSAHSASNCFTADETHVETLRETDLGKSASNCINRQRSRNRPAVV